MVILRLAFKENATFISTALNHFAFSNQRMKVPSENFERSLELTACVLGTDRKAVRLGQVLEGGLLAKAALCLGFF